MVAEIGQDYRADRLINDRSHYYPYLVPISLCTGAPAASARRQ